MKGWTSKSTTEMSTTEKLLRPATWLDQAFIGFHACVEIAMDMSGAERCDAARMVDDT